jgi:amino acid transporter
VTTVRPVELAPDAAATQRSLVERSKLRRELGRLDAICLLIAAIVVLDTLGAVAKGGAQTLVWLAVVAVLFFVPAGLAIAELGAAFPNQSGPYVWARLAFGRYTGSLVSLIYFLETPVWVGGSAAITCVAVVDRLLVPLEGGWRVPVALAFIWATVALAVAPLRAGKRVPLAGAAAQVALLGFFTLTVVLYAALWSGLGTADPDAHLPDGFTGQRLAFTLAELVPLALVLAAALLLARPARRHERAPAAEGARP